jgi:hypothetical protein
MARRRLICASLLIATLGGCPASGGGEGWISGSLWVRNCDGGDPLEADGQFDLGADSFFGDPLFDSSASASEQRSSVLVRIQETASNVDEANSLLIQFYDTVKAAQAFVAGEPIPMTDESLCPDCTDINTAIRMQLNLYVRCPTNKAPMTAAAYALEEQPTSGTARDTQCLLPTDQTPGPACPVLDDAARAGARQLCEQGDYQDQGHRDAIIELLGDGGACLFLCQFGEAEHGDDAAELEGFEIDYGDRLAGFFSTRVVDTRSVRLNRCAGADGQLVGMFSFELVRSRVGQPFP